MSGDPSSKLRPETVLDIEDPNNADETSTTNPEGQPGNSRKTNTDSGFHEEEYSTPTPSTSGGRGSSRMPSSNKRHFHHSRRKANTAHEEPRNEGDPLPCSSTTSQRNPSHDSLLSNLSDVHDYHSIHLESSESESSSSSSSSRPHTGKNNASGRDSARLVDKSFNSYRKKKLGIRAPAPLTPPPTSCGLKDDPQPSKTKTLEYDFPSDTELSEIIAIMSGLASPRKLNKSLHHLPRHGEDEEEEDILELATDDIISYELPTHPTPQPPPLQRGASLNLYEKHNSRSNAGITGSGVNLSNGNIPNGTLNRRYLPKQGKSLDLSTTGSYQEGMTKKQQSVNSLNDILKASKAGTLPNMPKAQKKKKKKPAPPPPKRGDEGDDNNAEADRNKNKLSWKQRLKLSLTIIVSILLILSSSSLLFIVPIVVDPILVGLEARFSNSPAQCRTVNKRNGTGANECTTPTCREGCTADLMFCYFIEVEYRIGVFNTSAKSLLTNSYLMYNHSRGSPSSYKLGISSHTDNDLDSNSTMSLQQPSTQPGPNLSYQLDSTRIEDLDLTARDGILLVNPNGCGYPPEINCTEFDKKFGEIGYTFPCYYSNQNESIVVPFYSRDIEIFHLVISLVTPCGLSLILSGFLYLLLQWKPKPRQRKKKKDKEKIEDPILSTSNSEDMAKNQTSNGKIPAANNKLGNIMGDLTGMTAKNVMKMHNYSKFHASVSNPPSLRTSRAGSLNRGDSLDLELDRIEEQEAKKKASQKRQEQQGELPGSSSGHYGPHDTQSILSSTDPSSPDNHRRNYQYNDKDFKKELLNLNGHISSGEIPSKSYLSRETPLTTVLSAASHHISVSDPMTGDPYIARELAGPGLLHRVNTNNKNEEINPNISTLGAIPRRMGGLGSMAKGRNSMDSVDSLDSIQTMGFGKL